jgi:hypothetical protein
MSRQNKQQKLIGRGDIVLENQIRQGCSLNGGERDNGSDILSNKNIEKKWLRIQEVGERAVTAKWQRHADSHCSTNVKNARIASIGRRQWRAKGKER